MPIRITLDNHEVIEADVTLADWSQAFQRALEGNTMIQIAGPDGEVLSDQSAASELGGGD